MASLDNYNTFRDLLKFAQMDKTITRQDLPYFSSEHLTTLISLALDELARRLAVQAFVTDKIAHGRELLEASSERTLEALRTELAEAIDPKPDSSFTSINQKEEMSSDELEKWS